MNYLSQFNIPFVGLKKGVSLFNYRLDDEFFSHFSESLIHSGDIGVDLSFEKRISLYTLVFDIDGTVVVECDRCLEPYNQPLNGHYTVYLKLKDETVESNGDSDVIYITYDDTHMDVSKLIYDYVSLTVPTKKVHPDRTEGKMGCNEESLKYLNDVNKEDTKNVTDPRWAELEKLKSKIV